MVSKHHCGQTLSTYLGGWEGRSPVRSLSKHGFESPEQCQWALLPPTDVDGFVSGRIWAIARVGDTSDVRKVEKQRLNALSFNQAQAKIQRLRGCWQ